MSRRRATGPGRVVATMPGPAPVMVPRPDRPSIHRVVALVYDGLTMFEFSILTEVFGRPRPELTVPWYGFEVCAVEPGPLRTDGGLGLSAPENWEAVAAADTLVVPGWRDARQAPPVAMLEALRAAERAGRRVVSICSGVFPVAAAGLLDGRRATTHWRYADLLREMHPEVHVNEDVLYVADGRVFTSAGSAAGIDLCLHLVRLDHGPAVANHVARRLVMPAHRDGGQRQFIPAPVADDEREPFADLLEWIDAHLRETISAEALGERAHMSLRTLTRRFRERTGMSPLRYVRARRVEAARVLLEETSWTLERIAHQVGFSSAQILRRHFVQVVGTSPSRYRAGARDMTRG